MAFPTNRVDFTERCLRMLGKPVIEINVDESQVADRVDDAINKFFEFHRDGVEKMYLKYQITAGDVANTYIPLPNNVLGVTKIFQVLGGGLTSGGMNMFDVRYQYMLNNLPNFTSLSYVDYEITMMHIEMLNNSFSGQPGIRFNTKTSKLWLDIDWKFDILPGQWVIIEAFTALDMDGQTKSWSDDWLFRYATSLIKKQWGANLSKFASVQLPGGIVLDGDKIYNQAIGEITMLELELRDTWEEPPMFIMG